MSAFLVKRGATMVTKEEAKAAVETEIALNPSEADDVAEGANFARSLVSFELPIQHRPDKRVPRWSSAAARCALSIQMLCLFPP